ncbi:MAG: type II CAAX endopeptidase family protein [Candidatus Melainabacteria bacterium]|nr:type II CAAX endopeptidase family protein [Candidatus Melainabacteria bacterium]
MEPPSRLKLVLILVWSLLPCIAIWIGLYEIKSAAWTFLLYHGLVLTPAIWWGRKLWVPTLIAPKIKHCALLVVAALVFTVITILTYEVIGKYLLSNDGALDLLKRQGFNKQAFWPLSIYAIVINPIFEEIYWRGVVLNELEKHPTKIKHFALIWSSLAYALFHYFIFRMVLFPGWAELGTIMLAIYGAILAVLYRKTGSIIFTALAHGLLTDLACIALILDLLGRYPGSL